MFQFKKPRNELEFILKNGKKRTPSIPDEMFTYCPSCKKAMITDELSDNANVCSKCGYHFYINARMRLHLIADKDSFTEVERDMQSTNVIGFPDYEKKLKHAKLASSENEAVVTGLCSIAGVRCAVFVMEKNFMMGSMGTVVGEKITRLFETAIEQKLPVVGFTVSGGARMQEGILSLMQMAKTSGAVSRHSKSGLLYITVLTNPTTGGVTASFAMAGDIILSEPDALICFAGPRVIAQTTRQKLPAGFQKAEFLLEKGFIDAIVKRTELRKTIGKLLWMHS
jgi:acetyl-CoA carboxylase carboxyl transferase beta subunit